MLYLEYLGLREKPFSVTSDPSFLYLSRRHREALSHMMFGIQDRKGFVEITGEIGAGKTTLCKMLLRQLDQDTTKTALILHTGLSELQLLEAVIQDFGLDPMRNNRFAMFNTLNRFLLEQATLGNNVVLIIDEAQNLSLRVLEQIRMLSNLETEKEKLIQIVLVGQPQLKEKLNLPGLQQLQQRISVRYHIMPLDNDEIRTYIEHRLRVAGSDGMVCWSDEAIQNIFQFSKGIPRLINMLCDRILLACYVFQTKQIDHEIVQRSVQELSGQISTDAQVATQSQP